jgi:hypothetical protein
VRSPENEERAILAVLEKLEREARAAADDEQEELRLEREYTEVLGLLPYENEPVPPSAALRSRLLEAVRAEAAIVPIAVQAAPVAPAGSHRERPIASRLAAAAMVVAALGLAGLGGYLAASWQGERARAAAVEAALAQYASEADSSPAQREMEALEARFSLVTTPGVEICRLEPRSGGLGERKAQGHLYIAPDHEHWLLTVHGLDPCRGQQAYHVWFVTDDGPVSGGFFHVAAGRPSELGSEQMPSGIREVIVTLEPSESSAQPTGPTVLYGDEPEMVL